MQWRRIAGTWRLLVGLALLLGAGQAQALCLALLGCSCTVTTTPLNLGTINPLSVSAATSTATVQVACGGVAALLVPYKIELSTGGGGSYANRRLASGSNTLNYNLFTDSGYNTIWGNDSGGSQSVSGSVPLNALGLAPPNTHTIYGRIPGGQTSTAPGTYIDTITVTITYD